MRLLGEIHGDYEVSAFVSDRLPIFFMTKFFSCATMGKYFLMIFAYALYSSHAHPS